MSSATLIEGLSHIVLPITTISGVKCKYCTWMYVWQEVHTLSIANGHTCALALVLTFAQLPAGPIITFIKFTML